MIETSKLIDAITELDTLCSRLQTELDKAKDSMSGLQFENIALRGAESAALQELAAEKEKNRWIPVGEGPPEKVDWKRVVEAVEDCAKVPVFVTMEQIFMDEGSDFTHWRPIILPKE